VSTARVARFSARTPLRRDKVPGAVCGSFQGGKPWGPGRVRRARGVRRSL
jgi:hypothetical protein